MAYSGLISFAVEIVHDAVIGSLAFTAIAVDFGMTFFWVAELLIGACLFVALYFITNKNAALVVFGMLVLTSAAHGFFSLVASGALVSEPRLRPTAFGVRASCLHLGWLVGSVIAAFISDGALGFRPVMLMGALATLGAAAAAAVVGSVERPRFSGVAVNANPLFNWVLGKEAAFKDRAADRLSGDSGGSAEWWTGRK
jgi:predicted MFS family arabinose efflux permease